MAETGSNLARVLANVVDIQQTVMLQFDNVTKALDNLKVDNKNAINSLREDLRRTDDRSQKQIDELKSSHQKEVDRLLNIIQTLLSKESLQSAPHQPVPAMGPASLMQQQNTALQQAMMMQQQRSIQEEYQRLAAQMNAQNLQNMINMQQKANVIVPPTVAAKVTPTAVPQKEPVAAVPDPAPKTTTAPIVIPPAAPVKASPVVVPTAFPTKPASSTPVVPTFSFGPKPTGSPVVSTPKTVEKEEDDAVEDYEPQVEFKPVIPLPALVDVKTGEEGEDVLFSNRSKLYIYTNDTQEWKERGTGELKVLKDKKTKKTRVVMRRDQVLKVCANFQIVSSMTIQVMAKNEKAYTWFCEDFSEDEPEHVKLSARFANVDIAKQFKELFEKAAEEHKSLATTPSKKEEVTKKKEEVTPKKEEVTKKKEELKEEKPTTSDGATVEIPSNKSTVGFGDKFKPEAGSWECPACYVRNKADDQLCSCCGTGKDGKEVDKAAVIFGKPSILKPAAPGAPKFTFGMSAAAAAKEPLVAPAPTFGASPNGIASPVSNASFGASVTPKPSIFGGGKNTTPNTSTPTFSFGKPPNAAPSSTATPTFSFLKASESVTSSKSTSSTPATKPSIFGNVGTDKTDSAAVSSTTSSSFCFKTAGEAPKFGFGQKEATVEKPAEQKENVFGSFTKPFGSVVGGNEVSFASLAAKAKETNIFEGETARKAQEEFKNQRKSTTLVKEDTNNEENDETNEEEYEAQADFKPIIPLPDLVEVKTGEEDEEVLFKARCKLFKFFNETKENKERGVGDVKILRNKENKSCRVLMRREQVHKICANFRIVKGINLTVKPHMPNVYTFMCHDFSEDTEGETCVFTIKFKDEKIATEFKEKFEEIRKEQ